MQNLGPKIATGKTGAERFRDGGRKLSFDVLSFWRWSASDLLSNATRGIVAEFLLAQALGVADDIREEWAAYDLLTSDGIKVEVKSAAYLQSWSQRELSKISFLTPKTLAWDAESNRQSTVAERQADVYVFALLAHQDKATVDPLDVAQWEFYVLPTSVLDARTRSQHSITLPSLKRLASGAVDYAGIAHAVRSAMAEQANQ